MRHFFLILIILNTGLFVKAESVESKYNDSLQKISDSCLSAKREKALNFCNDYQDINSQISRWGEIYSEKILKAIPFPTVTIFGSYIIKSLIDQKVVIDPHLTNWGSPKIEVKPDMTTLSFSYNL